MSFALFKENDRLLPAFCKPYPDELLSSWLTRVAFNHGLSTIEFCKISWSAYTFHPDIDRFITDDTIQSLAEQTNCSFEQVKNTTLWSYEHKLFEKMHMPYQHQTWLIHSNSRHKQSSKTSYSSGLMFCPGCLKKQCYFKKQWRLAISFACTDCKCYLAEACPHCKKGNSFMDIPDSNFTSQSLKEYLINCHHCGKDVTASEPVPAPERFLHLQRQLYAIVENGHPNKEICPVSYFSMLYYLGSFLQINRFRARKINQFINEVITHHRFSLGAIRHYKGCITQLPVKKRAVFILMAHWLLLEWPFRLLDLCVRHNFDCGDILSGFKNEPAWFKSSICNELPLKTHFELSEKDDPGECTARMKKDRPGKFDYDWEPYDYDYNAEDDFF